MKIFRNRYFFSIVTAVVTGVFFAFIILLGWMIVVNYFPSNVVPIYTAEDTGIEVVRSQPTDVDAENAGSLPVTLPPISATSTTIFTAKHDITAQAFLVATIDSNFSANSTTTIALKDGDRARPIASLTKLATAVVAKDLLDQNAMVTITPQILATYYGDPGGLRNKENIKVSQLFYPLLMVSSNDAGEALARAYPDGRQKFIKAMNDWAYSIGAYNTYFADPTGLSPENVSSPHDLAVILRWIYRNRPELIDTTRTKVKYIGQHTWVSPTQLLNLSSYLGGKNGYIPESDQTSASIFNLPMTRNGKSVDTIFLVVTLDSSNRDQDVLNLIDKIRP